MEADWRQDIEGRPTYKVWKKLQRLQKVIKERSKPLFGIGKQLEKAIETLYQVQQNHVNDRMNADKIIFVK